MSSLHKQRPLRSILLTSNEDLFADQQLNTVHVVAISFFFFPLVSDVITEQNTQYPHFFDVAIF